MQFDYYLNNLSPKFETYCLIREFYERIILCNSLVWSCALTGKPNLTYAEAQQSEESALQMLEGFPREVKLIPENNGLELI